MVSSYMVRILAIASRKPTPDNWHSRFPDWVPFCFKLTGAAKPVNRPDSKTTTGGETNGIRLLRFLHYKFFHGSAQELYRCPDIAQDARWKEVLTGQMTTAYSKGYNAAIHLKEETVHEVPGP